MKRSGLTLGLAFLATGFLLGCQETSSNLVTPDPPGPQFDHKGEPHGKGGKNDGGSSTVLASASGAIETVDPSTHEMAVNKDNKFVFSISTFHQGSDVGSRGVMRRNFAITYATHAAKFANGGPLDPCWTEGPENVSWAALFELLNNVEGLDDGTGRLSMGYDKMANDAPSADHGAGSAASHAGIGGVLIGISGHVDPTVVGTKETVAGNDVYTFGGGTVRIWLKKNPSTHQKIFCPNAGDEVVVTVFP